MQEKRETKELQDGQEESALQEKKVLGGSSFHGEKVAGRWRRQRSTKTEVIEGRHSAGLQDPEKNTVIWKHSGDSMNAKVQGHDCIK